jgi:hypothetical protein
MQKTEMLVTKDVAVVKKGKNCLELLLLPQHFIKLKALKAEDYVVNHSSAAGGELLKNTMLSPLPDLLGD